MNLAADSLNKPGIFKTLCWEIDYFEVCSPTIFTYDDYITKDVNDKSC